MPIFLVCIGPSIVNEDRNPGSHGIWDVQIRWLPAFLPFSPLSGGFRADRSLGRRRERRQTQEFVNPHPVVGGEA